MEKTIENSSYNIPLGDAEEPLFLKFLLSAATYGSKRSFSKDQSITRIN